jgi:hypothetical protein
MEPLSRVVCKYLRFPNYVEYTACSSVQKTGVLKGFVCVWFRRLSEPLVRDPHISTVCTFPNSSKTSIATFLKGLSQGIFLYDFLVIELNLYFFKGAKCNFSCSVYFVFKITSLT